MLRWLSLFLVTAGLAQAQPEGWREAWPATDFSQTLVPDWRQIQSGGPPRDGIPALTDPVLVPAAGVDLPGAEGVVTVVRPGQAARAYPLRYLMWHEIVNDRIGGVPVAVTWCPLCNTALVFDRRVDGQELEFGVSGLLRFSDLVMYDRQTESWWQQAEGLAIVGTLAGRRLTALPVWMESWDRFRDAHPDGLVMAEPGAGRPYGANPYQGYDSSLRPFLYTGEDPPHGIAPLARLVRVGDRAWPLARLAAAGTLTEAGLTLTWQPGQASALDAATLAGGRDVGQVRVRDAAGRDVVHEVIFAFAFHALQPDGTWMLGP